MGRKVRLIGLVMAVVGALCLSACGGTQKAQRCRQTAATPATP